MRRGDEPLPWAVRERLTWYDSNARHQRTLFSVSEVAIIVLSASIPLAVALQAPSWVAAVLGALVVIVGGCRQVWRWGENWIRSSRALLEIQHEVVDWSAGAEPYQGADADRALVKRTEAVVRGESQAWAAALQSAPGNGSTGSS